MRIMLNVKISACRIVRATQALKRQHNLEGQITNMFLHAKDKKKASLP